MAGSRSVNLEANKNDDVIRLGDIFRVLWKNIILIAIITVAVFVVGIIYTFGIASPTYSSTSVISVVKENSSGDSVDYTNSRTLAGNAAELITQEVILREVAHDFADEGVTLTSLKDMISVSSETTSYFVYVTVECGDAVLSGELANALVNELINYSNNSTEGIGLVLQGAISVTTEASTGVYTSPNKVLYLAIFLIGGLVVGCIVAYVKEFCSSKFRTRDDIESYLDEKVIGYFIDDKSKDRNVSKAENERRSVELVKPSVRNYEPYNKLFTNIKYSDVDNPYRVIMFTSSQEKELKSSTLGNLACCLAYNKQNVVVIDMDMRKPIQHKMFKVPKDSGIIEYIDGSCSKDDIIKHTEYGVDVITAGKKVINPIVIIESSGFKKLIAELVKVYDYVLIDTPPALACSDAAAISKLCDGVIFNVAMRDVKKKKAAIALQSLKDVDAKIIGVNVTKAEASRHDDSYYYYSDKYYISAKPNGDGSDGESA